MYGVRPHDPAVIAGAPLVLAAIACWPPWNGAPGGVGRSHGGSSPGVNYFMSCRMELHTERS